MLRAETRGAREGCARLTRPHGNASHAQADRRGGGVGGVDELVQRRPQRLAEQLRLCSRASSRLSVRNGGKGRCSTSRSVAASADSALPSPACSGASCGSGRGSASSRCPAAGRARPQTRRRSALSVAAAVVADRLVATVRLAARQADRRLGVDERDARLRARACAAASPAVACRWSARSAPRRGRRAERPPAWPAAVPPTAPTTWATARRRSGRWRRRSRCRSRGRAPSGPCPGATACSRNTTTAGEHRDAGGEARREDRVGAEGKDRHDRDDTPAIRVQSATAISVAITTPSQVPSTRSAPRVKVCAEARAAARSRRPPRPSTRVAAQRAGPTARSARPRPPGAARGARPAVAGSRRRASARCRAPSWPPIRRDAERGRPTGNAQPAATRCVQGGGQAGRRRHLADERREPLVERRRCERLARGPPFAQLGRLAPGSWRASPRHPRSRRPSAPAAARMRSSASATPAAEASASAGSVRRTCDQQRTEADQLEPDAAALADERGRARRGLDPRTAPESPAPDRRHQAPSPTGIDEGVTSPVNSASAR